MNIITLVEILLINLFFLLLLFCFVLFKLYIQAEVTTKKKFGYFFSGYLIFTVLLIFISILILHFTDLQSFNISQRLAAVEQHFNNFIQYFNAKASSNLTTSSKPSLITIIQQKYPFISPLILLAESFSDLLPFTQKLHALQDIISRFYNISQISLTYIDSKIYDYSQYHFYDFNNTTPVKNFYKYSLTSIATGGLFCGMLYGFSHLIPKAISWMVT